MYHDRKLLASILIGMERWIARSSNFLVYSLIYLGFSLTPVRAEDNILVIHSYHPELSRTKQQQTDIDLSFAELNSDSQVFHEFLDSKRHPQLEHQQEFINYINKKYHRTEIDLLMVVDEPSLQLTLEQHDRFFSNLPVVFLGIKNLNQELLDTPWLTGVLENYSVVETALEATRQMWTNSIIIINDSTASGQVNREQIKAVENIAQPSLQVETIQDLKVKDIQKRLAPYPDRLPILLLGQLLQDGSPAIPVEPEASIALLQKQIPNPIYTEDEIYLGQGIVGGKIFDRKYHIRQAVELAQQLLEGAKPDEVGPFLTGKNRWVFDYRQLVNHNIKLDLLPDDSELLYVEPPFYIKYRTLVIIVLLSFICSFLTIVLLIEKIRKRAIDNKKLQENEQRYKDLAEAGANVFWELDRKLRYSYISGDVHDLCGLQPEKIIGYYPPDLHCNNPLLDIDWELFKQITTAKQPLKNFTFSLRDQAGGVRIFKVNGNPLFDQHHTFQGYRGVKQEITAEQNLYQQIAYQATYDDLTGLLNRREFNHKLEQSVQKAQKYHTESVLCYLDLDRFKIVNDTAGHLVGDRLLSELAQLLQTLIRKEDTLGRLGGDEFGLLLEGCSLAEAQNICQQLISAIENYRLQWKNIEFDVGVSIGVVGISTASRDAEELLSRADLACYQAKNLGRGRVCVVEDDHQDAQMQQVQLGNIANVAQAIKENRFYLLKQLIVPIIDDGKQRLHYELLLRLRDREGNVITPQQFIPVAERYGVISNVDRWVLETTLNCYQKFFASESTLVSINLSSASINDERFANYAIDLIQKSQIPGDCLCFEITETAAISQIDRACQFIETMKNLGVKFALDDFGSGIASFRYLQHLPVDYLKIDGNLVKAMLDREYNRIIVNSIIEVAHTMGIKTIAEFVENESILQYLSKTSIDYAQGYITGAPVELVC